MVKIFISRLHSWDMRLCRKISGLQSRKALDIAMYFFSRLGDGPVYAGVAGMLLLTDRPAGISLLRAGLPAFAFELTAQSIVKHLIRRPRPCDSYSDVVKRMPPPDEFSFPSGHTGAGFLMAALISRFFPGLSFFWYLLAAGIGVSRVYNGVHYPGDVVAGMLLGIASAKISLLIFM